MSIAISNSTTHTVDFADVLYAPKIFVLVLSHSKLRAKDVYYYS